MRYAHFYVKIYIVECKIARFELLAVGKRRSELSTIVFKAV